MANRIIVGHDGSSRADDGLALAARIASGSGARLTIAYIYHKEPPVESQDREYRRELRDRTAATLGPALEKLPTGVKADSGAFPSTTAADGLRDLARAEEADMIVIGSTHHGPVGSVLIGSVGELLCSGSPCAVAVAPHGYRQHSDSQASQIGIAFDGSDESVVAVRGAVALAQALNADALALTVTEKTRKSEDRLKEQLATASSRGGRTVQLEHEFINGHPATELAEASKTLGALVVGSRGYGPLRHVLLGGVSGKLMRSAQCPLIVFPRGAPPVPAGSTVRA